MAYLNVLALQSLEGTRENHENPQRTDNQDSRYHG